ncbi:MAG: hypothetical protein ACPHY8_01285 [Patescibacteria group bacterium]
MKVLTLFTGILFSTSALSVTAPLGTIPEGYTKVEDSIGAAIYKNGNFYAVYVDLDISTINLNNLESTGDYNEWGHANYVTMNLSEHWSKFSDYSTFALINGQFFDHETDITKSPVSYPLIADTDIIQVTAPDPSLKTQSLYQTYDNKWFITDGFSSNYSNKKNLLVGFDITQSLGAGDLSWSKTIDRTYVGGIPKDCDQSTQTCYGVDKLVFLIGNNKNANSMINEIKKWGIPNNLIIRLDGSDSTQLKSNIIDFDSSGNGARKIPHSIEVTKY